MLAPEIEVAPCLVVKEELVEEGDWSGDPFVNLKRVVAEFENLRKRKVEKERSKDAKTNQFKFSVCTLQI
jgi:hypothetical protein